MRQEKNIIIHIQSVYSYIPLDSSQYNVLCIISSIRVKCIQNLLASSSEIWIWYIQLSFKVISFLYYITIQPFFYSIHTEILTILWGPQSYILFQERNKTELVKYHFWLHTYSCLLPSYCRYDSFSTWLPFQYKLSDNVFTQLTMFAHCNIIKSGIIWPIHTEKKAFDRYNSIWGDLII